MKLTEHFEKWQSFVKLTKSRKTADIYIKRLTPFIREYRIFELEEIKASFLADFVAKIPSQSAREQTIAALTSFKNFLEENEIPFPSVPKYARTKTKKKLPNPISEEVFWKMMEMAEKEETEFPYRKACLILMGLAGLRIQEVLRLLPTQVEKEGDTIWIFVRQSKGDKDRRVPIAGKYGEWIYQNRERLFPLDVHENTIRSFLSKYGKRAGDNHVYPHRLRHFFATTLTSRGVPVQVIQKLLGHSSPTTTMVYSYVADSLVESAVRKLAEK